MFKRLSLLMLFFCFCSLCHAQSNDIAFSIGGTFSPDVPFPKNVGTCVQPDLLKVCGSPTQATAASTFEGEVAHRFFNLHEVSFALDLPILGTRSRTAKRDLTSTLSPASSSLPAFE